MTTAVAIALYNGEKFLQEQLDSLKNQTQKIDKVVLCDDGSKDNTVDFVRNYITQNELTQSWNLVVNEQNLGFIKNFYKAMELCDTDLIFMGDQDDLWELDKVEKMTNIMKNHSEINLLSCEYGVIDSEGKPIKSFLESDIQADEKLSSLSLVDILRVWQRPGMTMCVRRTFFEEIYDSIKNVYIPHDFALALCAADIDSFYVYNYVGAYHRRHNNNAAREEHRIFKLMDLERKLKDVEEWINYTENVAKSDMCLSAESKNLICKKVEYLSQRHSNLKNRKLFGVLSLVKNDKLRFYRKVAVICDLWIVCFGKYKKQVMR